MSVDRGVIGGCMRLRQLGIVALFLVALLGFSSAAFGQATGTLTGTITDQKGLAMSGANIVIHNADTGIDHEPVMTNDTGVFVVPLLPPGNYDVTASQTGFATVQHKAIPLQVGQTVRVDLVLPVATTQSLVTVTTEIPVLETEKTEQSANINENLVSNLPVSSRRWEQLALLTGGTNPDGTTGAVSFHGLAGLYNNNTVDGAANTTYYDQTTRGGYNEAYVYSSDSVREFAVKASGFSAELGQAAGGTVNAVTRSGSAQFHGDLFYNGRSPGFNAQDPVNIVSAASNGTQPVKNVLNQHQWGGSFGGPIIKDKLFFFVTDDGFRKSEPLTVTSSQLNPGIGALPCPTLTVPVGAETAPSAAQCLAAKNYILAHFLGAFPREMRQDIELIKIDYHPTQANSVFVETNFRDYHLPIPNSLQNNSSQSILQDRFVIADLTTVIGSNKVNEFRYQWGIDVSNSPINTTIGSPEVTTGLFTYGNGDSSGLQYEHRTQLSDNFSWTRGAHQFKFGVDINVLQDDVRGSVTADGPYAYSGANLPGNITCKAPAGASSATVSNIAAFCAWMVDLYGTNSGDGATGQHFVTFSQTHDNAGTGPSTWFVYNMPTRDYAGYAQDNWKIRPNMTLNIGLRYDVQAFPPLPNSVKNLLAIPGALPPGSFDLPILDYYTSKFPSEYDGIQPRLGFAWNFRKSTVLRVGGGEFFAETAGHNLKNVFSGAGEATTKCSGPVTTAGNCISTTLRFPQLLFNQQLDSFPGTLPLPGAAPAGVSVFTLPIVPSPLFTIRGADPNLARPRAWEANAAIEQQLPGNVNFSVSYVFTRGLHIPRGQDGNIGINTDNSICTSATGGCGVPITKTYDILDANNNITSTFTTPFYFQRKQDTSGPLAGGAQTGGIPSNTSTVNTMYNAMVVTARKPMRSGVEFLVNYTLSHAIDNGTAGAAQLSTVAFDPFNNQLEKESSSNDVRNRFTTSVVWAPTWGNKVSNAFEKQAIGGWSLSSSFTAQNGGHYTPAANGSGSQSVTYCTVAAAGCTYSGFFGPGGAVLTAASGKITGIDGGMAGSGIGSTGSAAGSRAGFLAPDSFVLPNLYDVDVRLEKQFAIKERFHIDARLEAFNLFNSTLVQAVNTTAFNYVKPGASGCPATSNVTCMAPNGNATNGGFGFPTITSTNNLGARQLQAGIRFDF